MALYYWVGKTANGNVNIPANWSLWGASGGQTALPPEALTIPKYNDNLAFGRYTVGATSYPIFGPSGQLNGLCGPAGNTAGQYCPNITVYETCPVPLGTTAVYFKVGAGYIDIKVPSSGGPEYAYYLDLADNQGVTKPNADVRIFSKKLQDFNIKGYARSVATTNSTTAPSYANVYLRDIELSNPVSTVFNQGLNSFDNFYLYPSTSASTAQLYLNGRGTKAYIEKGWSWSEPTVTLQNTNTNQAEGPQVIFLAEGASGASGPGSTTRTYVKEMNLYSNSSKDYPRVDVYHGLDITTLNLDGGQINFAQSPTTDQAIVQKGSFVASKSRLTSTENTLNLGTNGIFYVANASGNIPEIIITGTTDYTITPGDGYSGNPG